jgi:hypothetical protein
VKIVKEAKNSPRAYGVMIQRSDGENCKKAKNGHKKRKRESKLNIERRNRKDMCIDQYGG